MPWIEIGCTPNEEDCVQVSSTKDYLPDMEAELKVYKDQLTRTFPPPEGCYFSIKWSPHDFGRYGEVRAVYTSDYNEEALNWALDAEVGCDRWDEQALKHLADYKAKKNPD